MMRMQRNYRLEAFLSDIHFPFHDERAWQLTLSILKETKPDIVFLGGDIVDCYAVSKFSRDPHRVLELQHELDVARAELAELRKVTPNATMYWLPGNHENRIESFKRRVVEIAGLRSMRVEELLGLRDLNIKTVTRGSRFKIGELCHMHGDEVNAGYINTARNLYLKFGGNAIVGHYHKSQVHHHRLADGTCHVVWCNPCLCKLNQEYMLGVSQWQQGFTMIKHFDKGYFSVSPVVYFDYGTKMAGEYDGRLYSL